MEESGKEQCYRTVLNVLAKRGWQLVRDETGFAEKICAELRQRETTDTPERVAIERATIRHYCQVLHGACSESGSSLQKRAFEELWRYLYPIALYKTHNADLAQDLTQQALEKVWKKISQCREPGSFLSWATLILINEIREHYRHKGHREEKSGESNWVETEIVESEMEHSDESEEHSEFSQRRNASIDDGFSQAVTDETQRELFAIIRTCIKNPQQQKILVDSFFNDKGYKEIAEELGITVGNVHVLRHRALSALRKCEAFIQFIEDQLQ